MAHIGRTLFRFGGALLLGASAVAIDDPRPLFAPTATAPVVIAVRDIPRGATLDAADLVIVQRPVGTLPAAAYISIDSIVGRVTRIPIFEGDAIVPGRLAPIRADFDIKITPGKRAFAFQITDVSGLAGMIKPNSRVDVLVIVDGASKRDRVAKLFMENMRVLAFSIIPRQSESDELQNVAVATLEVTPKEGERLAIARTQGQLQLMLRGDEGRAGEATTSTHRASSPTRALLPRP